ncbi:hypothetical protein CO046_01175 [Candidatus Peregrinibacteria bacterium CG_4_9_14_0_2_um_filter_53_11]|nr:MAG: hypothetical protein CO046_01175 [Candidatus Peregrinibacteria bacterium CG_4_9_14_0_2_um_filter_53_11]
MTLTVVGMSGTANLEALELEDFLATWRPEALIIPGTERDNDLQPRVVSAARRALAERVITDDVRAFFNRRLNDALFVAEAARSHARTYGAAVHFLENSIFGDRDDQLAMEEAVERILERAASLNRLGENGLDRLEQARQTRYAEVCRVRRDPARSPLDPTTLRGLQEDHFDGRPACDLEDEALTMMASLERTLSGVSHHDHLIALVPIVQVMPTTELCTVADYLGERTIPILGLDGRPTKRPASAARSTGRGIDIHEQLELAERAAARRAGRDLSTKA